MAGFYQVFDVARQTEPDETELIKNLRALDATAGVQHVIGTTIYNIKKSTPWLPAHITAATTQIQNTVATSPQLTAQQLVDKFPIVTKALILALIDEINILRAAAGLPERTPAQAITAIRNKAATL